MRLSKVAVLLVAISIVFLGADFACVTIPPADSIVTSSPVRIGGLLLDDQLRAVDGEVRLAVNGAELAPVATFRGAWVYPSVALPVGVSTFAGSTLRFVASGQIRGSLVPFTLERRTDLVPNGRQDVLLRFLDPNLDGALREMAIATLEPDPAQGALASFPQLVKSLILQHLRHVYLGTNVRFSTSPADFRGSTGIHRLDFDATTPTTDPPGLAFLDYNNLNKNDRSVVSVLFFRTAVVNQNRLLAETPARSTDSVAQRARDIAILLGSEAADGFALSLGLVAEGEDRLHGCMLSHNCPAYDASHPLADRFGEGHFVMDPPGLTPFFASAGFASRTERIERVRILNSYNASYVRIVTSEP